MSSIIQYPGDQKVCHPQRPEPYIIRNNNAMPPPPPPPPHGPAQYSPEPGFNSFYHPYAQGRPQRKRRRPPHSYASLISQAILTSKEQKLTLREIYEWVQVRYPSLYEANETGWQNTIRHNLSLNKCFRKLPRHAVGDRSGNGKSLKGSYWTVDLEQLNNTTFGKQILETGFLSSIEYWHQQQQEELRSQQAQRGPVQHGSVQRVPPQYPQGQVYHPQGPPIQHPQPQHPQIHHPQAERPHHGPVQRVQSFSRPHNMDYASPYDRYTTETDNPNMVSYLANMGNKRQSFSSTTSSKTSSIRDSASPRSIATTEFANTPPMPSQPQPKMEMDPLFNPSLMRVNNILN